MPRRREVHRVFRGLGLGIFRHVLPDRVVAEVAGGHAPQMRQRALTLGVLMGLLAVAQLHGGIRAVPGLLRTAWARVRHRYRLSDIVMPVSRQAFSKRLKVIPWEIFRDLLGRLLTTLSDLMNPGAGLFHGLFTVQAIDRTVVDVAARLIGVWKGKTGKAGGPSRKAQLALDAMYDVSMGVPRVAVFEGARGREIESARRIIQKGVYGPRVIYVLDRGYMSFSLFRHVASQGSFFVIRKHRGARYHRLERFGPRDHLVQVGITDAHRQEPLSVRLVGVREDRQIYWYYTNLLPAHAMTPQDIRVLYRMRWQVELFFRTLKRRMNATRFFCFHPNGIRLQIYVAFCVHILVRILMAQSAKFHRLPIESLSFDKALTTVQCWMWERWDHIWIPRPRRRYFHELLDLIPVHCLTAPKRARKHKKGVA